MVTYEYGRIAKLAESLENAGVTQEIIDQVMEGGENILKTTAPVRKADWMSEAMQRMNRLLDKDTRHAVREACACCLGGQRLKLSQEIARKFTTLEERIQAANETKFVFGHSVTLESDGKILVRFGSEESPETHRCVCLPQAREPLPILYCYCCGGHIKHHLQIATGRSLDLTVRSSALSSGGKKTCSFLFAIKDY
jgi:hypothetical protein